MIHNREAHGDCLNFFQNEVPKELKVVFHCYSGSLEMAKELWKRGYYLGFGGTSTYKNNKKVREVLAACPEDGLSLSGSGTVTGTAQRPKPDRICCQKRGPGPGYEF